MPSADDADLPPSSPPPTIPTQHTPGPRALALQSLYQKTLSATLSSIPYSSFASCFPTIASSSEAALKAMHAGMISRLEAFAWEEFEMVVKERRVVEGVNELERLIGEASKRRARAMDGMDGEEREEVVPPHTLPPTPLIQAHTNPLHIAQNGQLNARLQTTQSQNATLIEEIRKQKQEIEVLMSILERGVSDVESAGLVLGEKVAGLSEEGRGAREVVMEG